MTTDPNPTKPPRKGGPVLREEALWMLLEGYQIASIARKLQVQRSTVREWRDSPFGQEWLKTERAKTAEKFVEAREEGTKLLRRYAVPAIQALVENLHSSNPFARSRAAAEILDRVGITRSETLQVKSDLPDLSGLSDEEIAVLTKVASRAR